MKNHSTSHAKWSSWGSSGLQVCSVLSTQSFINWSHIYQHGIFLHLHLVIWFLCPQRCPTQQPCPSSVPPPPALQVQQCVAGRPQAVEAFLLCIGEGIPVLQLGSLSVFTACEWGPLALSQGQFQAGAVEIQAASTLLHVGPAAPTPTPQQARAAPLPTSAVSSGWRTPGTG